MGSIGTGGLASLPVFIRFISHAAVPPAVADAEAFVRFATREIGEVLVVEVDTPWLDGPRAASLRDGLAPLIGSRLAVIVDLSPVRYLDLFAFDALLAALQVSDGAIAVCCPDPGVASMFATTLPNGTIPLFPDIDAALVEIAPAGDDKALLKS